jgi:hypothetical protein
VAIFRELVNKRKSSYGNAQKAKIIYNYKRTKEKLLFKTTLSFVNQLPEDGNYRPKHVGGVPNINKLSYFYCCAFVGINIGKESS